MSINGDLVVIVPDLLPVYFHTWSFILEKKKLYLHIFHIKTPNTFSGRTFNESTIFTTNIKKTQILLRGISLLYLKVIIVYGSEIEIESCEVIKMLHFLSNTVTKRNPA